LARLPVVAATGLGWFVEPCSVPIDDGAAHLGCADVVYLLDNPIRSHPWGSARVIPELLGVPPTGQPQAELWLGALDGSSSFALTEDGPVRLDELVRRDPTGMLGPDVVEAFGPRLPYLLKVLAVERPLSIQAHPTREQAEAGFAAENDAGIPIGAADRSYSDPFHKPELVVALSDFAALIGFRIPTEAEELMGELGVSGLDEVVEMIRAPDGLADTVRWILTLPADRATNLATAAAAAIKERSATEPFTTLAGIADLYPNDRGLLMALLLQIVQLPNGAACAVPAATPHCYLHGVVVEAQAASDNTLRAGLTPKRVDVPELLAVLRYQPGMDPRLPGTTAGGSEVFELDGVQDVRLHRVRLNQEPVVLAGSGIVLVTEGQAGLSVDDSATTLDRGASAFVPANRGEFALTGMGTAFVATPALKPVHAAR
jgi:mannose-6-phosphate isomerase